MDYKTIVAGVAIGVAVVGCGASHTESYEMGRNKGREVPVKRLGSTNARQTCNQPAQIAMEGSAAGTTENLPRNFSPDDFVAGCVDVVK